MECELLAVLYFLTVVTSLIALHKMDEQVQHLKYTLSQVIDLQDIKKELEKLKDTLKEKK